MREGGLIPILEGARSSSIDLQSQCARAMRNLSVNREQLFYCVHAERFFRREGAIDHWKRTLLSPVLASGDFPEIVET